MKAREAYALPPEQDVAMARAIRLEWWSIGSLTSTVAIMGLVMGSSSAMRTAWIEDALSLIPPIAFLIAARVRTIAPSEAYPYGRHRAMSIAFLIAAIALFAFGLSLLVGALATLLRGERPTIGYVWLGDHSVWEGWLMIAVLMYSIVPPVVLGLRKLPLSRALHAKVLYADAAMNKADWQTGLAAIAGVLGIGFGLWWADAVAAGAISLSILFDGVRSLRTVIADLMDHSPRAVDSAERFDVIERVQRYFAELDWVHEHELRFREEGDVCAGEVFVRPKEDVLDLPVLIGEATRGMRAIDWRLYDVVVTIADAPQRDP
jgi:divalent metal cation (Fe/Co/Zn/Cd) transporter